jgi:hypothetical protein
MTGTCGREIILPRALFMGPQGSGTHIMRFA